MMTASEFSLFCRHLALKSETVKLIQQMRASLQDSQAQASRQYTVASLQTGQTIQIESTLELALIGSLQRDSTVLEIYSQPSTFQFSYVNTGGRLIRHPHTPDYFVIRRDSAGWIEAKEQGMLRTQSEEQPNRYRFENGIWVCPPGIAHAKRYGLQYTVHCHLSAGN